MQYTRRLFDSLPLIVRPIRWEEHTLLAPGAFVLVARPTCPTVSIHFTISLHHRPSKSLNSYREASLCIMGLSTIIPSPAIVLKIQSVILLPVSKCRMSHTETCLHVRYQCEHYKEDCGINITILQSQIETLLIQW
jgi:hypothetical protein